ncbi:MAG: beta-N-acetylglucosaminidase domain-containing protein, partial [Ginsengibacter sp.]
MDKSEASKVAIFGVAMYSWNMKAYNPQQAWEAANKYIMPEAPEAFMLFNSHNSDLGPNGHGYRREESAIIKPIIDSFLKVYKNGTYDANLFKKIQDEFTSITLAPGIIKSNSGNKRLIEQIMPWLIQFEWLGKSGSAALEMVDNLYNNRNALAWDSYLKLKIDLDSMDMVDKKYNQNPYQPGIKTGSLVLTPFVKALFELGGNQLLNPGKTPSEIAVSTLPHSASSKLTNSEKLKNQPLQLTNNSVAYSPVLESITLLPGDYFGIKVAKNLKATELLFDLRSGSLKKWGAMEWSGDGENWKAIDWTEKNGKGRIDLKLSDLKFIRFINHSKEKQTAFLKEFKVLVESRNQADQQAYALDGSIQTFEIFSKQKNIRIDLPENFKNKSLILLISKNENASILISVMNTKGKKTSVYNGKENYLVLDKKKLKKVKSIILSLEDEGSGKVYEIIPGA